jgi:hypothetical protein
MRKSCWDSPALEKKSEFYPANFRGRVPKRIKMSMEVHSEMPFDKTQVYKDLEYDVWVNSNGAMSAIVSGEILLGIKPGECEIVQWHEVNSDANN